jgi:Domain of Unknown Function (DUF1080)
MSTLKLFTTALTTICFFAAINCVVRAVADSSPTSVAAQTPIAPTGHINLFNGKDFSGWNFWTKTKLSPEQIWSVKNGMLECAAVPASYMRTVQTFENYKLTVVWRFVKVTPKSDNIGILIHMRSPDELRPVCIKCQGQHNNQGGFWLYHGFTCDQYQGPKTLENVHIPATSGSNENPVGQWNTFVLICKGKDVKFYVNGKLDNQLTGCNPSFGNIGIQTEGGQIELSKMYLDPLSTASAATN